MPNIHFFSEEINFQLSSEVLCAQWIEFTIAQEKYQLESLNYIFCSDEYLHKINVEYLNHDFYTDIITFDNSQESETVEGDLFISIDRVKDNARQLDKAFTDELRRVMVHGVLHLLGYDDKSEQDQTQMRKKENAYLSLPQFNFS